MEITNVELGRYRLAKFVPHGGVVVSSQLMEALLVAYPDLESWTMGQIIAEQKRLQETLPPLLADRTKFR